MESLVQEQIKKKDNVMVRNHIVFFIKSSLFFWKEPFFATRSNNGFAVIQGLDRDLIPAGGVYRARALDLFETILADDRFTGIGHLHGAMVVAVCMVVHADFKRFCFFRNAIDMDFGIAPTAGF